MRLTELDITDTFFTGCITEETQVMENLAFFSKQTKSKSAKI